MRAEWSIHDLAPCFVPQADPGAAYRQDAAVIELAIDRVLRSGRFVLGDEGAAFETEFAAWLGVAHGVGCASGTDALHLALVAAGVGPGMTVATVAHTAVATVAAIEMAGATPLLLDIEPTYYTLDPDELDRVLRRRPADRPPIAAVVAVHLYGQAADVAAIGELCARHGVALIEDCSQAHGAMVDGIKVGGFGQASAWSFYPTKNLAALGDGGMVAVQDGATARRLAGLRQYGWDAARVSHEAGRNSRLDELQAAVLRARLPRLEAANARRGAIAAAYDRALRTSGLAPPARRPGCGHVFHQYVVRAPAREALRASLLRRGVATAVHYAPPLHRQPAYAGRVPLGPARCRRTETAAAEVMSLPIFPEMTDDQIAAVCHALGAA